MREEALSGGPCQAAVFRAGHVPAHEGAVGHARGAGGDRHAGVDDRHEAAEHQGQRAAAWRGASGETVMGTGLCLRLQDAARNPRLPGELPGLNCEAFAVECRA